jgi:hypothetical protein
MPEKPLALRADETETMLQKMQVVMVRMLVRMEVLIECAKDIQVYPFRL